MSVPASTLAPILAALVALATAIGAVIKGAADRKAAFGNVANDETNTALTAMGQLNDRLVAEVKGLRDQVAEQRRELEELRPLRGEVVALRQEVARLTALIGLE